MKFALAYKTQAEFQASNVFLLPIAADVSVR